MSSVGFVRNAAIMQYTSLDNSSYTNTSSAQKQAVKDHYPNDFDYASGSSTPVVHGGTAQQVPSVASQPKEFVPRELNAAEQEEIQTAIADYNENKGHYQMLLMTSPVAQRLSGATGGLHIIAV